MKHTNLVNRLNAGKVQRWMGLLGLFIAAVLLGVVPANTGSAHASLLGTTPEDGEQLQDQPTEVVLEFSEPVGIVEGGTTLHSPEADPIVLSPEATGNTIVIPLETVGHGAHIVQWRVVSADGHPISGTVSFTVGDATSGSAPVLDSELPGWIEAGRAATVAIRYLGLLAAFGLVVTGWLIARPDIVSIARLAAIFAIAGLVGLISELPFTAMIQTGSTPDSFREVWNAVSSLSGGTATGAYLAIAFVILAIVMLLTPSKENEIRVFSAVFLGGALATFLSSGHTRTREPTWLMMLSDATHLSVAAIWIGGLIILALGLSGRWRGESFATSDRAGEALSRFSTLAGYTAALVIATGLAMAFMIMDSFSAVIKTTYGRTLSLKIGLVGLVVVLAAANRFRFIPMISESRARAMSWLRRLVTLELLLLVCVVGVTSTLVHLDPNTQVEQSSRESTILFEDVAELDKNHSVQVLIQQDPDGELDVSAKVLDSDGSIVTLETDLELHWSLPAQQLGPIVQTVEPDRQTGEYSTTTSLRAPGEWRLEIRADIDRFTDSRTTIEFVIPD